MGRPAELLLLRLLRLVEVRQRQAGVERRRLLGAAEDRRRRLLLRRVASGDVGGPSQPQ